MPTYEYACQACGNEWEAEQSIKDAPLTECPACKAQAAKRQISKGAGFILKGGWYSTSTPPRSSKSEGSSRVEDRDEDGDEVRNEVRVDLHLDHDEGELERVHAVHHLRRGVPTGEKREPSARI
ncbi:MAG: zinc ribbon domain-containing protein [Polyangiaceae bacterium]